MATAIPVADLKVFPTANDINGGSEGAGNIVTEDNLDGLLAMLPPKNFVISGLDIAYVGDYQVSISSGSAFIEGRFVEIQASITYTLDPLPSVTEQSYAYISLGLLESGGGPLTAGSQVTAGQIQNAIAITTASPGDPAGGVLLGVAIAAADGKLLGSAYTYPSKRSFGGGTYAGSYRGDSNETIAGNSQKISLPFTPSFVYISGDAGTAKSKVVSCSALLPAGDRTVSSTGAHSNVQIGWGSKYSMGFSIVPSELTLMPKYTFQTQTFVPFDAGVLDGYGVAVANEFADDEKVRCIIDADFQLGDNSVAWHHPALSDQMMGLAPFSATTAPSLQPLSGGSLFGVTATIVPNNLIAATPQIASVLWIKNPSQAWLVVMNLSGSTITGFTDGGTGTLTTCFASVPGIEGSRANVVMSSSTATTEMNKPIICEGGFIVNDSFSGGINNSGMSLNGDNNLYYYWAMSS